MEMVLGRDYTGRNPLKTGLVTARWKMRVVEGAKLYCTVAIP